MLSEKTIEIVKSTAPVLAESGEILTKHFYRRMFEHDPQVKPFFNASNQTVGTQQRALAGAICAYAQNIDNLGALGGAVELIAQKHASLGVKEEHYPIVGKHLLASIKEVLGDAATDDVINAWAEAYGLLQNILVGREGEIYDGHQSRFGWQGFKDFVVERKEKESEVITSFYLKPVDGQPLAPHHAGQYLTVRFPTSDGSTTMRNYSLSAPSNSDSFRISVKLESNENSAVPNGVVSEQLHHQIEVGSRIEVGPPCGEFVFDLETAKNETRPIVFLSGGVGTTPILAMLHEAVSAELDRDIFLISGALNSETHAFTDEVSSLKQRTNRLVTHYRYSSPLEGDQIGTRCDSHGFIDSEFLQQLLPSTDCDFYMCGPKPFMQNLYRPLLESGVPESQLRFEFFGPLEELESTETAPSQA